MHISTFHSIKEPLAGHRFAYCTLAEESSKAGVVAHVAFYNATSKNSGQGTVVINKGDMPSSDQILSLYQQRDYIQLASEEVAEQLKEALDQDAQKRATDFARANLKEICADITDWNDKGLLAPNSALIRLRRVCGEYIEMDDALTEAERIVSLEAMRFVVAN